MEYTIVRFDISENVDIRDVSGIDIAQTWGSNSQAVFTGSINNHKTYFHPASKLGLVESPISNLNHLFEDVRISRYELTETELESIGTMLEEQEECEEVDSTGNNRCFRIVHDTEEIVISESSVRTHRDYKDCPNILQQLFRT